MAFEFDRDSMSRQCLSYISRGMVLAKLHGIWPDGRCTCGNPDHAVGKAGERTVGKHPVGLDWGDKVAVTEDDVCAWIEEYDRTGVPFNVGVLCGPRGGMIDSEDDDAAARAYRESIGMAGPETPTWTSGKSTHQLTLWDDALKGCKGVQKPGGLEVRIGAGGKAIQSVLPPSWHWSGVQYQWRPTLSPDEIPVAPTPRALLVALVNGAGERTSSPDTREAPASSTCTLTSVPRPRRVMVDTSGTSLPSANTSRGVPAAAGAPGAGRA